MSMTCLHPFVIIKKESGYSALFFCLIIVLILKDDIIYKRFNKKGDDIYNKIYYCSALL